ncbi:fish-egg lectin-like [Conger conger]|uniref:fish-egg lectin-like n=1 Tax=Conger conger TaxID=82655 RepID=UPI002A5A3060|nr:fish-egg lectin-like [Conger conger]
MSLRTVILLISCLLGTNLAMDCREVPGKLKQIDAGLGQVFGVNENDRVYTLYGGSWTQLPGALKHVTVGPSGVWGVNKNNQIYKLVGGGWVQVGGSMKQVDAGGHQFVVGVNMTNNVYCMGRYASVRYRGPGSPAPWNMLPGHLMYYSCGPNGCWGVNSAQDIYMRKWVTPAACEDNTDWQLISGKLAMIEVGTDGSVYGVDAVGDVYRRDGITAANPAGIDWIYESPCTKSKHVSYDAGHLWVVTKDNRILDCVV